jgi:hypothetical protein
VKRVKGKKRKDYKRKEKEALVGADVQEET